MEYKLKVLSMHELGHRSNQEDYMYPAPGQATDNDRCFVLCDGMGGHDSGEVASQAVCNAMGGYVKANCPADTLFTPEQLRNALAAAYDALDARDTHAAKKMGTTMTFANFHVGGCLVAHMGDSRVYHLRPSLGILFETRDHSLVNDLIKIGELTEETAKTFGQKNVITRCMQPNNEYRSRADIKEITDIRPGDYFFMCSDGVNEVMESRHLANVILDNSFSDEEKMRIIKENTVEARDNHTAYLIHVLDVKGAIPVVPEIPKSAELPEYSIPVESPVKKRGIPKIFILPAAMFLVALSIGAYFLLANTDKATVTVAPSNEPSSVSEQDVKVPEDTKPVVEKELQDGTSAKDKQLERNSDEGDGADATAEPGNDVTSIQNPEIPTSAGGEEEENLSVTQENDADASEERDDEAADGTLDEGNPVRVENEGSGEQGEVVDKNTVSQQ